MTTSAPPKPPKTQKPAGPARTPLRQRGRELLGLAARSGETLGPWPGRDVAATRLFTILLVLGLTAGPVALVLSLGSRSTPQAPPAPVSVTSAATSGHTDQLRATSAATSLVGEWLGASRADEARLRSHLQFPPEQIALPDQRPEPVTVTALATTETADGLWTVIVQSTVAATTSTWQVDVITTPTATRVVTLPGRIPNYPTGPIPGIGTASLTQLDSNHPVTVAAAGFAKALLTGTGDLARWTAPNTDLATVTPTPCLNVTVTAASPDDPTVTPDPGATALVAITVSCAPAGKTPATTTRYGLRMAGRDSRWEVAAVVPVGTVLLTQPTTPTAAATHSPS